MASKQELKHRIRRLEIRLIPKNIKPYAVLTDEQWQRMETDRLDRRELGAYKIYHQDASPDLWD